MMMMMILIIIIATITVPEVPSKLVPGVVIFLARILRGFYRISGWPPTLPAVSCFSVFLCP